MLTSAFHAVSWGHRHDEHVFTENDWTVLDGPGVDACGKSKTLAERAAWEYVAHEAGGLELAAMLPVAVMRPVLGRDVCSRPQQGVPALRPRPRLLVAAAESMVANDLITQ